MVTMDTVKEKLIKAAEKKHGKVEPCDPPFTFEHEFVIFWFNTEDGSSHIHTHTILEEVYN